MKKIIALILVTAIFLCIGGLSGKDKSHSPSSLPTETHDSPVSVGETNNKETLTYITAQQGISMTVGGETQDGCYSLDTYPDGTADIIYYDYNTMQCIRLAAEPNVGHDANSTAYIPSTKGGVRCFVAAENLYVIKNGQPYASADSKRNDPIARVYCMNLDGSDRKVLEYGANIVFQWEGGVACDTAGNLYTVLDVVDTENVLVKYTLARISRQEENYTEITFWDEPTYAKLVGVYDEGFIICLKNKSDSSVSTSIVSVGIHGEANNVLLEWMDNEISSYTICENILYYTKEQSPFIYRKSIPDCQNLPSIDTSLYDGGAPDSVIISCEPRDNHLILLILNSSASELSYVALDLSNLRLFEIDQYVGQGENRRFVGIFGEGEKDFLVCTGTFTRKRTDYGTDGLPYSFEQGFQEYALIEKEKYWGNLSDYRKFDYYK